MRIRTLVLRAIEVLLVAPLLIAALYALGTGGEWSLLLWEAFLWFVLIEGLIRFLRRDHVPVGHRAADDEPDSPVPEFYGSEGEAALNGAFVQVDGKDGGPGVYV